MPVESNRRGLVAGDGGPADRFPVGMRVLAVDDDEPCLKVLETMLRKCQYQVTTANKAADALRMLRENKNKYDLVISDVNMPDIDGFQLLQVVGLEMDLPVIMLSAYSDTERVMKGVTHGACDYLVKPVRIQELKNIWQHVIRRRKFEPKVEINVPNQDQEGLLGTGEGGPGPTSSGDGDQSEDSNRKRKDHSEDEEEDGEENDDPSRQKKPRVVWSMELHQKFVAAVNQLGFDKAVPKKILDLMNVEGLTRENVASHLQKFRIYLRKMQAKMAVHAGKDSSYLRMGALDGFGDFHSLGGSGRFSSSSPLSSYPAGGSLGRLNSLSGLRLRGSSSPSGLFQPSHSQNLSSSSSTLGKLQSSILPSSQNASLFQGVPSSLDFKDFGSIDDATAFGGTSNSLSVTSTNALMLQGHPQPTLNCGGFSNQASLRGAIGSSNVLNPSSCSESWQTGVQLASFPSNSLPLIESFSHTQIPPNNGISPSTSHIRENPIEMSSTGAIPVPLEGSRDMQCQGGLIGNVVHSWENQNRGMDFSYGVNNGFSALNSMLSSNSNSQRMDQTNLLIGAKTEPSLTAQLHSGLGAKMMRSNEEFLLEQTKSHDGFVESLDDLINTLDKREQNASTLMDGEYIWAS